MDPSTPTLMESLKEAVHARHARMEALPFISALTTGQLPLESYVGQLRAMAVVQGTLEHELSLLNSGEIRALLQNRPSRLIHLRKDLSVFDTQYIPEIIAALAPAQHMATLIRRYRVEQPTSLLGVVYVLEGTLLGNAVHLPDVLRTFGDVTSGATHYYKGHGDRTAEYWRGFCSAMNTFPLDHEGRLRIIQVALHFFDQLEVLFSALYPIQDQELVFTASMLNPEAGDHPVPQDVREIEAAVAAGRQCREEFPYFEERYQERGRGFTKSDAAWLATLVELPETELLNQVEWLGRVLGNRGMPRITLERQLELLQAGLAAAVPEKAAQFHKLLEAAEAMKRERFRYLQEAVADDLASAFQLATDGEMQGRFRGTGALIVSAVCDQEAGITEAVHSLQSWLTDADRFSPPWIAAVARTFLLAKGALRPSINEGRTP